MHHVLEKGIVMADNALTIGFASFSLMVAFVVIIEVLTMFPDAATVCMGAFCQ
jgi:hypothetical protein